MANKSVKEFKFSPAFGFTGSAGKTEIKSYLRGGSAKKTEPVKRAVGGSMFKPVSKPMPKPAPKPMPKPAPKPAPKVAPAAKMQPAAMPPQNVSGQKPMGPLVQKAQSPQMASPLTQMASIPPGAGPAGGMSPTGGMSGMNPASSGMPGMSPAGGKQLDPSVMSWSGAGPTGGGTSDILNIGGMQFDRGAMLRNIASLPESIRSKGSLGTPSPFDDTFPPPGAGPAGGMSPAGGMPGMSPAGGMAQANSGMAQPAQAQPRWSPNDREFAKGGAACACGGKVMKKGGSSKLSKSEKKMAVGLIKQMSQQAVQTGRMPGMPAPRAKAVPVASQTPLIGMKKGGAKVGKVMSEYGKGELHSGSKSGPVVKDRKQAIAIALGASRK